MFDDRLWDELEAAGLCECGSRLARHRPIVKPRPLQSWHAQTSGARCVRLGLSDEAGIIAAASWRAKRATAERVTHDASDADPARRARSSRLSGHRTRRTAPPADRVRP